MANKKVRIGVIGTGSWANYGHMAVYQQHPQVKLVGVCDIDPLRAEKSAKTFGAQFATTDFTKLVERNDIDAVDIVTPNVTHAPIALAVMKSGKHVICEKPLAMSYHQAKDMAQVAQETGVKMGSTLSIAITQQPNMLDISSRKDISDGFSKSMLLICKAF